MSRYIELDHEDNIDIPVNLGEGDNVDIDLDSINAIVTQDPRKPQVKVVVPNKEKQSVVADEGFRLEETIVEPIPDEYINPQGEAEFNENGTYNVREVNTARVNVPMPSGEILIEENNKTYDVTSYATAKVKIADTPKGEFYVKVYDYDGTLLDEAWLDNGETYTVPTAPPEKERLNFDGWRCTQEIVDGVVTIDNNNVLIGAHYTTKSGMTEVEIELTPENAPNIETKGCLVTIVGYDRKYWDYENDQTTSSTGQTHTYYKYGKYIIAVNATRFHNQYLFGQTTSKPDKYVKHLRINALDIPGYRVFGYCYALETVSTPYGASFTGTNTFAYDRSLKCIVANQPTESFVWHGDKLETAIFGNVGSATKSAFNDCDMLENLVIPKGATSVGTSFATSTGLSGTFYFPDGFTSVNSVVGGRVTKIVIPTTVTGSFAVNSLSRLKEIVGLENTTITELASSAFSNALSLKELRFPATLTTINSSSFYNCFYLKVLDFSRCAQVPTLGGDYFTHIIFLKIVVPDALYDEWITATNWVKYADYIHKASEVEL